MLDELQLTLVYLSIALLLMVLYMNFERKDGHPISEWSELEVFWTTIIFLIWPLLLIAMTFVGVGKLFTNHIFPFLIKERRWITLKQIKSLDLTGKKNRKKVNEWITRTR